MIFGNYVEVFKMNNESGKTILGRIKTKVLMTNKEELIDEITPLKSMQGIVGYCISTSLSIISFLSFFSISSSFVLNSFSCLTLSFSSNYFLSFSSFSFLSCSSSSPNSCSNFSLSFCSLL